MHSALKLEKSAIPKGKSQLYKILFWNNKCPRLSILDLGQHSALKLEKSAISKVQKHTFCYFKNGKKKSIFAQEKKFKTIFGISCSDLQ